MFPSGLRAKQSSKAVIAAAIMAKNRPVTRRDAPSRTTVITISRVQNSGEWIIKLRTYEIEKAESTASAVWMSPIHRRPASMIRLDPEIRRNVNPRGQ